MTPRTVVIEPKQQGKGRSFRASLIAAATADKLWPGGKTDSNCDRPVFAVFAGSDAEMRAFVANLTLGRAALYPGEGYRRRNSSRGGVEFLKSAGFKVLWQRETEGTLATIFLPELFAMDPGMVDPKEAKFLLLPSTRWAAAQALSTDKIVAHARRLPLVQALNRPPKEKWERERWSPKMPDETLAGLVATSHLFAAYLDRRTRAPIVSDPRFYLQLMLACLKEGVASWSQGDSDYYHDRDRFGHFDFGFKETGNDDAGLHKGIAFRASHEVFEPILANETALFFELTNH